MRVKVLQRIDAEGFWAGREVVPACPKTGEWLTPPDCVDKPVPASWPAGYWPRWNGDGWRVERKAASGWRAALARILENVLARLRLYWRGQPATGRKVARG